MALSSRWPRSPLILLKQTREVFRCLNVGMTMVIRGVLTVMIGSAPSVVHGKRRIGLFNGVPNRASSDGCTAKIQRGFTARVTKHGLTSVVFAAVLDSDRVRDLTAL